MFLSFFQWREPETIAKLAVPVCMARVRADSTLSEQLLAQQAKMEAAFGVRPVVLQNDCLEISSTEARRLLFFGIADEAPQEPADPDPIEDPFPDDTLWEEPDTDQKGT